jgi:hypothetical protein
MADNAVTSPVPDSHHVILFTGGASAVNVSPGRFGNNGKHSAWQIKC